jgi:hypothetical protein
MAKIKYNIKLWVDTATNLATDTTVYKENDFIFATDTGVLKKGDGVNTYANLGSIGTVVSWANIADKPTTFAPSAHDHAVEDITDWPTTFAPSAHDHAVEDITDWPTTFPPAAHDHAVVADEDTGLEAAATLQGLAEALSARIADLDGRVTLLEGTP